MTRKIAWLISAVLSLISSRAVADGLILPSQLEKTNRCLHGQILDFTHNHGKDRRIWSQALCQKRDLYVYLPPNYDPARRYPFAIFLHGAGQDEQFFRESLVKEFDCAIREGKLPPFVVAAPDGSPDGRASYFRLATFWANTDLGRFEDYLMEDVWNFMMKNFALRPERDAHLLIGASMGGSGAFTQAIKHKDKVKIAMGFMPALNARFVDCHGRYMAPFDPDCWGWREKVRPFEVVGRPRGVFTIRFYYLYGALIGHGPDAMAKLSQFNSIEVMDQYDLRPGELDLYIGYGGKDEFNMMAQVESFLYRAHERKLQVGVDFDPNGRHDVESGRRLFPGAIRWAAPLLERYYDTRP